MAKGEANLPKSRPGGLKICFVLLETGLGGLEEVVVRLANGAVAHGVPSRIIVMEEDLEFYMAGLDMRVELLFPRGRFLSRLYSLRRWSQGHVVHLHFAYGHVRPLYRLLLKGVGPVIYTYHNDYRFIRSRLWCMIDSILARRLTAIVAVSHYIKGYCLNVLRLPPELITVIHNGVDLGLGIPPNGGWLERELRLICVARLVYQKRIDLVLHALAELCAAIQISVHLTIVGDGPDRLQLEKLARHLGISSRVTWSGRVAIGEVRMFLRESDFFISASGWEGFHLAVLEAMAEARVLIVSNIPPHREVVGEPGLYFSPGDHRALAQTIVYARQHPNEAITRALMGFERARQFGWLQTVEGHLKLYESVS